MCVYQDGALAFLGAPQVANWGGIMWLVPLMIFSVITGPSSPEPFLRLGLCRPHS